MKLSYFELKKTEWVILNKTLFPLVFQEGPGGCYWDWVLVGFLDNWRVSWFFLQRSCLFRVGVVKVVETNNFM